MVYNISMNNRQEKILKNIIEIYIKTAKPVGSQVLSEDKSFSVSPATIRNDMLELEEEDLIFQPHISAGRIPTMSGYRVYLDSLMEIKKINNNEKKELEVKHKEDIRELAKLLVEKTNLATIVSFSPSDANESIKITLNPDSGVSCFISFRINSMLIGSNTW